MLLTAYIPVASIDELGKFHGLCQPRLFGGGGFGRMINEKKMQHHRAERLKINIYISATAILGTVFALMAAGVPQETSIAIGIAAESVFVAVLGWILWKKSKQEE